MKKVVLSLVLTAAGFAPAFAAELTPAQAEPKKAEEMAVKPVTPQEKKEGGALLVAALCDQCTTPDKKDMSEEKQAQPEQEKSATAPKKLLA